MRWGVKSNSGPIGARGLPKRKASQRVDGSYLQNLLRVPPNGEECLLTGLSANLTRQHLGNSIEPLQNFHMLARFSLLPLLNVIVGDPQKDAGGYRPLQPYDLSCICKQE